MTAPSASPTSPTTPPATEPASQSTPITSARSLKQLSIFFLGATCFLASTTLTRRAIHQRNLRIAPKFYHPNTNPHEHFSPLHDAIQALNLATMNCVSLGMMGIGGTLWAFDTYGLGEMRQALRGHLAYEHFDKPDPGTGSPPEAEHENSVAQDGEPKASR
ncbi:hypothetical protein K491DRAFT_367920 [Lophiostoma macrostomum CBS 122681]|uniref:Altered inheritance of mitochondria protein 11 n=1 Tax=Lophiostoma macrostomum CBS 122681 TaxID=1314788 RepID=A0A6A6TCP0_9PLEO|nr:hypothetical protein K491DRAFT_367920 [Lophiostoma macrostomum CBS 122681]